MILDIAIASLHVLFVMYSCEISISFSKDVVDDTYTICTEIDNSWDDLRGNNARRTAV